MLLKPVHYNQSNTFEMLSVIYVWQISSHCSYSYS